MKYEGDMNDYLNIGKEGLRQHQAQQRDGVIMDDYERNFAKLRNLAGGSSVLAKAQFDPFRYAVRLKTGEAFKFEDAEITNGWVHFSGVGYVEGFPEPVREINPTLDRGIDVRIENIAWILDGTS